MARVFLKSPGFCMLFIAFNGIISRIIRFYLINHGKIKFHGKIEFDSAFGSLCCGSTKLHMAFIFSYLDYPNNFIINRT